MEWITHDLQSGTKPVPISRRKMLLTLVAFFSAIGMEWLNRKLSFFLPKQKGILRAGKPEMYRVGKVDGRWKSSHGIWIVRDLNGIYALSARTPRGTPVEWDEKKSVFQSPNGDSFYESGILIRGDKRNSLQRVAVFLKNGNLVVDPNRKFCQAQGDWSHPRSFVRLSPYPAIPSPMQVIEYHTLREDSRYV